MNRRSKLISADIARFTEQANNMWTDILIEKDATKEIQYVLDSNLVAFAMRHAQERDQADLFTIDDQETLKARAHGIAYAVTKGPSEKNMNVFMFDRHADELRRIVNEVLDPYEPSTEELDKFLKSKDKLLALKNLPGGGNEVRTMFKFISNLASDNLNALQVYKGLGKRVWKLGLNSRVSDNELSIISGIRQALQLFGEKAPHAARTDALALFELAKINSGRVPTQLKAGLRDKEPYFVFYTLDRSLIWLAGILQSFSSIDIFKNLKVRDARLLAISPGFVPHVYRDISEKICFSASTDLMHAFKQSGIENSIGEVKRNSQLSSDLIHTGYAQYIHLKTSYNDQELETITLIMDMMGIQCKDWLNLLSREDSFTSKIKSNTSSRLKKAGEVFVNSTKDLMMEMDGRLPSPGLTKQELFDRLLQLNTHDEVRESLQEAFKKVIGEAQTIRFGLDDFFVSNSRVGLLKLADNRIRKKPELQNTLSFAILGETSAGNDLFGRLAELDHPTKPPKIGSLMNLDGLSISERYLVLAYVTNLTDNVYKALSYCKDAAKAAKIYNNRILVEAQLFEISLRRRHAENPSQLILAYKIIESLEKGNAKLGLSALDTQRLNAEKWSITMTGYIIAKYARVSHNRTYVELSQISGNIIQFLSKMEQEVEALPADPISLDSRKDQVILRCNNQVRLKYISAYIFQHLDTQSHVRCPEDTHYFMKTISECREFYIQHSSLQSFYSTILLDIGSCLLIPNIKERRVYLKRISTNLKKYKDGISESKLRDKNFGRFEVLLSKLNEERENQC